MKKKIFSTLIILGLVLSLFAGVGTNKRVAEASEQIDGTLISSSLAAGEDEEGGASETVDGITYGFTIKNGKAEEVYIFSGPWGRIPSGTTITIPNTLGGKPVGSLGSLDTSSTNDSFLKNSIRVSGTITIDASEVTTLTTINKNFGYKKSIELKLPKSITYMGENVLAGSDSTSIYCDAINTTYKNASSFTGAFYGMQNSTAHDANFSDFEGKSGSAKVTFDDNGGSGGSLSNSSLYVYTNDVDNQTYIKSLTNILGGFTAPTKKYYTFEGYCNSNGTTIFDKNGMFIGGSSSLNTTSENTLTASYKSKRVTVYVDDKPDAYLNGADGDIPYAQSGASGYTISEIDFADGIPAQQQGKDFVGWTDDSNKSTPKWVKTSKDGYPTKASLKDLDIKSTASGLRVDLYAVYTDKIYNFFYEGEGAPQQCDAIPYSDLNKPLPAPTGQAGKDYVWSVNGKTIKKDATYKDAVEKANYDDSKTIIITVTWTADTASPSPTPTVSPSAKPSASPSTSPSASPSGSPSPTPSASAKPTVTPTAKPTISPAPSTRPTATPTSSPADKKSVTVGGITYRKKGDIAVVSGCTKRKASSLSIRTSVRIGDGYYMVTAIRKKALSGLKYLKKVKIGGYIKSIGAGAFDGCPKLKTITFGDGTLLSIGKNAFRRIYRKAVFRVPKGYYKDYGKKIKKKSVGWKKTMRIRKY